MQFKTAEGIIYTFHENSNQMTWSDNGMDYRAHVVPGTVKAIVGDYGGFQIAGGSYVKTETVTEAGPAVSSPKAQRLLGYDIPENKTIEFTTKSGSHYAIDLENKLMFGGKLKMTVEVDHVSDLGQQRIMVTLKDGKQLIPSAIDERTIEFTDRKIAGYYAHSTEDYQQALSGIPNIGEYRNEQQNPAEYVGINDMDNTEPEMNEYER